jgi:esterase/lipase superfamily enzyme
MHREYHRWHSPSLKRDMELLILGHAGARVIVFPSSRGRFYEWEDRGMAWALSEHLDRGWIQMYLLDSIDEESWYNRGAHPRGKAWRHMQYEHYLMTEVLPLSRHKNDNPFLIATGASFGAYHAANFAFRHPYLVGRLIGLSGLYDIKEQTGGYSDDLIYFNSPSDFVRHEHDHGRLEALRHMDIILVAGQSDPMRGNTEWMSHVLWEKGIGNALRIWDGFGHDWPWWQQMVVKYIGGHD